MLVVQLGGLNKLADGLLVNVIGIEGAVRCSLRCLGDLNLPIGAKPNRLSDERPLGSLIGHAAGSPIALSEGNRQVALILVPAGVLVESPMIRADDEVGNALVVLVAVGDSQLVALDDHALEDGEAVLVMVKGLDHAVVRQRDDEDVAVIAGVTGSADSDPAVLGILGDGTGNPGVHAAL